MMVDDRLDATSLVEIDDLSSDWLGGLFCYSFVLYGICRHGNTPEEFLRFSSTILGFEQVVYGGNAKNESSPEYEIYRDGVSMGCWGLFVYSASSAVYACKYQLNGISHIDEIRL